MNQYHTLRLILGDQLHINHSWFQETNDDVLYVMIESKSETNYVRHHIQKVVGFFLAMRQFAKALKENGHQVLYWTLEEEENKQNFSENIQYITNKYNIQSFEYQLPDEYRLDIELKALCETLGIETATIDTEHFLTKREDVADFFASRKRYIMEYFYRQVRKDYDILMEADKKTPLTGQWNYDQNNRKKYPKNIEIPPAHTFPKDASKIIALLEKNQIKTIGNISNNHFHYPITRQEALQLIDHFNTIRLVHFGDYQDAMSRRHWLGFHSMLSFALNIKLITPLEVVQSSIDYWRTHQDQVDFAQLEGFIRQIVGWREYMRGVYWAKMPDYATTNYFDHQAKLPEFYWTGDTKMNCLSHTINQSLDYAYAHHIQRLMVTGNFALLLGVHPDEVDDWYLGIYIDALQWVEITNTRGMSQFADGGLLATKPYVSSANYIHKMSDYCGKCHYDKKKKYGENACPFNSLYWDFYDRNGDKLSKNPRIGMMLRIWQKMNPEEKEKILQQADTYKASADQL